MKSIFFKCLVSFLVLFKAIMGAFYGNFGNHFQAICGPILTIFVLILEIPLGFFGGTFGGYLGDNMLVTNWDVLYKILWITLIVIFGPFSSHLESCFVDYTECQGENHIEDLQRVTLRDN